MLSLSRRLISILVTVELLVTTLLAGGPVFLHELPDAGAGEYGSQVNMFIGTGGLPWTCAMLSPAATEPFGCVRLGPDTCAVGGLYLFSTNTSGYYYEHRHIIGFSYGRLSGTGIRDYGVFRVTPSAGRHKVTDIRALEYSHQQETAAPGYYAVYLPGAGALAEMTATDHTGYQRYTFHTKKDAELYIDASSVLSGGSTTDTSITVDPRNGTVRGSALVHGGFSGRSGGLNVYYYAEFDRPLKSYITHTDDSDSSTRPSAAGPGAGVLLNFGDLKGEQVTLRAGISFVSTENAEENLRAEADGMSFDEVRAATGAKWEERLSRISIDADDNTREIFYTSLYHTMIMPTDYTDVNGEYPGFDKKTHTAEGFTYRSDMSLWDTVRDVYALYSLIAPEIQYDSLQSLICMAKQGGVLPRWPMGCGYTGSMFGNPANILFSESYLKGFTGVDYNTALDYMVRSADTLGNREDREYADLYNRYGYVPDDIVHKISRGYSVSRTLEYSWEDACAQTIARGLGRADLVEKFGRSAENYKNVWDSKTKYFRARNSDGSWQPLVKRYTEFYDDMLGTHLASGYCEGSPRQWRWNVMQDIDGMIELFGSKEYFVSELERFMEDAAPERAYFVPGSGYWVGNQHDIHTPYLFANAGRPDLTQKWVRWTLSNRFSTDPNGLDGNDDGGTLSAWYVFSALGLYPLAGSDKYWIGSPCVNGAEIKLDNGRTLSIRAENQSDENVYVSSVTVNGRRERGVYLTQDTLTQGGTITFNMSSAA